MCLWLNGLHFFRRSKGDRQADGASDMLGASGTLPRSGREGVGGEQPRCWRDLRGWGSSAVQPESYPCPSHSLLVAVIFGTYTRVGGYNSDFSWDPRAQEKTVVLTHHLWFMHKKLRGFTAKQWISRWRQQILQFTQCLTRVSKLLNSHEITVLKINIFDTRRTTAGEWDAPAILQYEQCLMVHYLNRKSACYGDCF